LARSPCVLSPLSSFSSHYRPHRHLLSLPTRRSSDLPSTSPTPPTPPTPRPRRRSRRPSRRETSSRSPSRPCPSAETPAARRLSRSEEHTSELQSRFDLVCRLLLQKKIPKFQ